MSHCYSYKLVVGLLFVLSVVPCALAGIKCWSCNSRLDPKCGDPFDNSTIPMAECFHQEKWPACRKVRQQIKGEWHYTRECSHIERDEALNEEKPCSTQAGTDNMLIEHCTCYDKDGCNSSHLSRSRPGVLGTLLLMPYLVLKLVM